jgi:hypothetical protein
MQTTNKRRDPDAENQLPNLPPSATATAAAAAAKKPKHHHHHDEDSDSAWDSSDKDNDRKKNASLNPRAKTTTTKARTSTSSSSSNKNKQGSATSPARHISSDTEELPRLTQEQQQATLQDIKVEFDKNLQVRTSISGLVTVLHSMAPYIPTSCHD